MTDTDPSTSDPYPEKLDLELPAGSLKRISALLKPGETTQDFVREAVYRRLIDEGVKNEARVRIMPGG